MDEIRVISGNLDGAHLRREKAKNRRYLRCDGKADDAEINEALHAGERHFLGLGDAWEQVYAKKPIVLERED